MWLHHSEFAPIVDALGRMLLLAMLLKVYPFPLYYLFPEQDRNNLDLSLKVGILFLILFGIVLPSDIVDQIVAIPLPIEPSNDEFLWGPSPSGSFSIKTASSIQYNQVWSQTQIGNPFHRNGSLISWLESLSNTRNYKEVLANVILILWSIWNARNKAIFQEKWLSPTAVGYDAFHFGLTYNQVNNSWNGHHLHSNMHIKWYPPTNQFLKLNFDGAVRNGKASIGFIIRNSDGNPLVAACRVLGDTNTLVAEATALHEGLHAAYLQGFSHLIVEGDSKLLIDCIKGSAMTP
ncbi:uncharacterized protein LOC121051340 [Rosa chinensis]|uniref:uncharacterized protein LOC121051340 n=1 Tax=Rosa chinensis TaxID=74649 RepID=UPI001AD94F19|nr:uncharacterized protein LOC121051340 [Rosa chinensis]